jgi:hypothetical protein
MAEAHGKRHWVFADGDLPPSGDKEPLGHEALMVVNLGSSDARLELEVLFEDRPPERGISLSVAAERVKCFRLDQPLGQKGYRIPKGQYALVVHSDVPVIAVFGRLDVRQPNMAYYSVQSYSF